MTYTYEPHGNIASMWYHLWMNSIWTPTDGGNARGGWHIADSAGNGYFLSASYNVTLTRQLILAGATSEGKNVPEAYTLSQNYPNPFNPSTTIRYELPKALIVRLAVYDILGREVSVLVNDKKNAGSYEIKFDASNLSSGVYVCRLQAGSFIQSRKLLLLK